MNCTITLYDGNGMEHNTEHYETKHDLVEFINAIDSIRDKLNLDYCCNCRKYKDRSAFMVEVPHEASICTKCDNAKAHTRWLKESDAARHKRLMRILDSKDTI